ncbi:MAG: tail fiber domain-containing protein [Hyphomicrobium sp.]
MGGSSKVKTSSTSTPDKSITERSDMILGDANDGTGLMGYAMPDGAFAEYPSFSYGRDYELGAEQVAPLNDYHRTALDTVSTAPGYEQNYSNAQALSGSGNYAPIERTSIGAFDAPGEIERFQNPYNRMVIGQGLEDMGRAYDKASIDAGHAAAQAGAWGGSRQALLEGEVARNYGDSVKRFVGDNLNAGYDKAVSARNSEIDNTLRTTAADNAENQRAITNQLGLAEKGNVLASQQAELFQGAGNLIRSADQSTRDASLAELRRQFEYPINLGQQLQSINVGSIGAYPFAQSGTQKGGGGGKGSQLLGTGITAIGSLFSDEGTKTEIRDDVDPEAALGAFSEMPVKSWQYSDEAQAEHGVDGNRHVGPMAQSVEEAFGEPAPEAAPGVKGIDVVSMLGNVSAALKALELRTRHLAPGEA